MRSHLGIRVRFTLLYSIALILTVTMVSSGIYFFVQRALLDQVESHLHKDQATISTYLKSDPNQLAYMSERGTIHLFSVMQGSKKLVSSRHWHDEKLDETQVDGQQQDRPFSIKTANGARYRILVQSVTINSQNYQISVAHIEEAVHQTLRTLALIILLILPLAVAISLGIGYFIAGRVLAPIEVITRKAQEIGAENLSERLPVGDEDNEFSRLTVVFNQTFARIEDSFVRLHRFTADASHELRTPLAAIRSIGETALHTPSEKNTECREICREAIGSILEESDRLRQLIDSLLQLSRADAGEITLHKETVDLFDLTKETVELLNVLAEEKRQLINISTSGKAMASIDRTTVRQALTNLLDNAIKYAPPESEINITVGSTASGESFIEIADRGCGIPDEDVKLIFDRFYRVDKGRSRKKGGAGLGLSISKWAVERNGGRIEVASAINYGSQFRVSFPG